jgi:flagellar biosynthesis protein FlhF
MNIQRFQAPSMRRAIEDVRHALGREALIVRSNRFEGGVEVVAAVDYDESLLGAFGNGHGKQPSMLEDVEQLAETRRRAGKGASEPLLDLNRMVPDRIQLGGKRHTLAADGVTPLPLNREFSGEAAPGTEDPSELSSEHASVGGLGSLAANRLDDVGAELRILRKLVEQQLSGLAWRDLVRHQPHSAGVTLQLLKLGLAPELAREIAGAIPAAASLDDAWRSALALLVQRLPQTTDPIAEHGGVAALIGPTGVGKTTTIAKLAGSFVQRHGPGSVGLITTDDFRLGAHEQLLAFGRVLGIPVRTARDGPTIQAALQELSNRPLVLIDTEGAGHRHGEPRDRLGALDQAGVSLKRYLLLAANAQRASLGRTVAAFSLRPLDGCVITKVDESGSLGEIISTLITAALPMVYLSDGQQVPDDLHPARAEDLVRRASRLIAPSEGELEDEIMGLAFHNVLAGSHV